MLQKEPILHCFSPFFLLSCQTPYSTSLFEDISLDNEIVKDAKSYYDKNYGKDSKKESAGSKYEA